VDQPQPVRRLQGGGDLQGDQQGVGQRQPLIEAQALGQGLALDRKSVV
jgi:hypothetical protein